MAEKIRVYDLARDLNVSNKVVMDILSEKLNLNLRSHASTISQEEADKVTQYVKFPQKQADTPSSAAKPKGILVKKAKPTETVEAPTAEPIKAEQIIEAKPEQKTQEAPKEPKIVQHQIQNSTAQQQVKRFEQRPEPRRDFSKEPIRNLDQHFANRAKAASNAERPKPATTNAAPASPQSTEEAKAAELRDKKKPKKPIFPTTAPTEDKKVGKKPVVGKKVDKTRINPYTGEEFTAKSFSKQKPKKKVKAENKEPEKITEIYIDSPLTVGDLAEKIRISAAEIVKELMMIGVLATVNQIVDLESIGKVLEKFEILLLDEPIEVEEEDIEEEEIDVTKLKSRAPVVTIMGHVDHGKTTLLDSIRATKHKIVSGEVGGITQSIGAYTVNVNNKKIVFIDTPGHETFTAMRARGAKVTDIAILVVAADDGIMPQTIESINHAKAAGVPIIIAVNKIDKPAADADKVLQQLTEYDLVPEQWGGDTIAVPVSALMGTNLDELLEYILLVAEVQELKANPDRKATGVVIEAQLDKGKGPVATMLVQQGTLKVGDCVVVGTVAGKVRALLNDSGERVKKAGPSTPVEILGLSEVPQAGDFFEVVENEKVMKAISQDRKEKERVCKLDAICPTQVKRDLIQKDDEEHQVLNIIIKADTHGSAEAVSASIQQIKSESVFVKVVHIAVGDISEADVMLAAASNAMLIGFGVKEDAKAGKIAERECIEIKKYDIIYQILEDVERVMLGLLQPEIQEIDLGQAEVRQVFTVGKTGKIAGCYVTEGKVVRNKTALVLRNGKEIFKGTIDMLKRFKDDAKEVAQGYECGISFNKFNDIEEGDIIKVVTTKEVERESLV